MTCSAAQARVLALCEELLAVWNRRDAAAPVPEWRDQIPGPTLLKRPRKPHTCPCRHRLPVIRTRDPRQQFSRDGGHSGDGAC